MSSRRWALKRESYENRSAVSVHVGRSDHRGQLNVRHQDIDETMGNDSAEFNCIQYEQMGPKTDPYGPRNRTSVLEMHTICCLLPMTNDFIQARIVSVSLKSKTFFEILRHQQPLWVSTQTGIKRRSKILELELLQEQSILTIKQ